MNLSFLDGRKTYLVSTLTILSALWLLFQNAITVAEFTTMLSVALGLSGLRAGVNKLGKKE